MLAAGDHAAMKHAASRRPGSKASGYHPLDRGTTEAATEERLGSSGGQLDRTGASWRGRANKNKQNGPILVDQSIGIQQE